MTAPSFNFGLDALIGGLCTPHASAAILPAADGKRK